MPDSETQARTPRIMRFPQLMTRTDASACRAIIPDPSRPGPPHHTDPRELHDADAPHLLAYLAAVPDPRATVAAATGWSPSWPWPPLQYWPARGRSPRSPSGPPMRPSRSGSRSAPAAMRPTTGQCQPRPPPYAARSAGLTPTPWPPRSAPGSPRATTTTVPPPTIGSGHGSWWWPSTARRYAAPTPRQVGGTPEEVSGFQPLLAGLDLHGAVVTADALHTHADAAEFLVTGKQAHYLFCVKANQPTLLARCQRLPWHRVPVADRTRDRGHSRIEHRTLRVVTVGHFGFPHAAQVLQVTRKTRTLRTNTPPKVADDDRRCDYQPGLRPGPPRPARRPAPRPLGPSRRCTTSATPPSPKTAPRSAPAPAQA
jgi:hypothetical protein